MDKITKERRRAANEYWWNRYNEALNRAAECFEAEEFNYNKCAMSLAEAKHSLSRAAYYKDVR